MIRAGFASVSRGINSATHCGRWQPCAVRGLAAYHMGSGHTAVPATDINRPCSLMHTNAGTEHGQGSGQSRHLLLYTASAIAGASLFLWSLQQQEAYCKQRKARQEPGAPIDKLPTYTSADVSKHNTAASGIWVCLVYMLCRASNRQLQLLHKLLADFAMYNWNYIIAVYNWNI